MNSAIPCVKPEYTMPKEREAGWVNMSQVQCRNILILSLCDGVHRLVCLLHNKNVASTKTKWATKEEYVLLKTSLVHIVCWQRYLPHNIFGTYDIPVLRKERVTIAFAKHIKAP